MSDEFDAEAQETGVALIGIYSLIVRICANLPIPISLPTLLNGVLHSEDMIPAVIRVTEIIEDQPLEEELQAGIWGACLHWLSAAHLYTRFLAEHEHIVGQEVRINLVTSGEILAEIAEVLIRERDTE